MTQAMMTENDDFTRPGGLTGMRAVDIARAVRERRLTPEAVIRAHLDRMAEADPVIRAFQAVRADGALADAEALGRRDDLGTLPLAGVPVAVKDNIDVAGLPTRYGSAATRSAPARRDDELVRRLRQAGAIPIGKTQLPELAIWPFTEPAAFPATRNPWDRSRTPGGSTGGGAAAVATGMAALALGSDGGGSIRVPAACCGVTGIKPGPGVVPLAGGASQHWHGLTAFGPLARWPAVPPTPLPCSTSCPAPPGRPVTWRRRGRCASRSPPGIPPRAPGWRRPCVPPWTRRLACCAPRVTP
jgi:amidase